LLLIFGVSVIIRGEIFMTASKTMRAGLKFTRFVLAALLASTAAISIPGKRRRAGHRPEQRPDSGASSDAKDMSAEDVTVEVVHVPSGALSGFRPMKLAALISGLRIGGPYTVTVSGNGIKTTVLKTSSCRVLGSPADHYQDRRHRCPDQC